MGLFSFVRSLFQTGQRPSGDTGHVSPPLVDEAEQVVPKRDTELAPVRIAFSEDDDFETDVVGESFRQPALAALALRVGIDPRGRRTFLAGLRPEPDNSFDRHAVAVTAADTDDHLGYLARDLAGEYQPALLQRGRVEVPAILTGGGDGAPHRGVCLDLTALRRLLELPSLEKPRPAPSLRSPSPPPKRPAPAPDPTFKVDVPPAFSTVLDGISPFERADVYALKLADGRFHTLPYDAWLDPEAPVRLTQKRPEEWSVEDFARRARVSVKTRRKTERHFLYNDLVECLYKNRNASPYARSLCEAVACQHVAEWPTLAPTVKQTLSLDCELRVPAFQLLATVLAERDAFEAAVAVCEEALRLGLEDGTKSGFRGRIARIRRSAERSARQLVSPVSKEHKC